MKRSTILAVLIIAVISAGMLFSALMYQFNQAVGIFGIFGVAAIVVGLLVAESRRHARLATVYAEAAERVAHGKKDP